MKKKSNLPKKVGKIATKENVKNAVKTTGSFIENNKKEILYVGGAIAIAVIGYKLFKATSKGLTSAFEDKVETVKVEVAINDANTTISKEQAQQFAKTLLTACNAMQPLYGTDEESIKSVFLKIKTGDDFKMVYEAFGMKNYNGNGSPPVGIFRHLDNYAPRDLVYWLKRELSPSDGDVYKIVKERVESADYVF
ncbi:hypothetical protein [Tenacibaculum maritimum]|uniref:hypothetical protein n=1 Tax=Tenacibaculum maritimum TaxID=107401 RepID=UPI0012E535EF|nr:hypothetical protein [Tenacibaculum maritimum]CAA0214597.1 conserved hypothetical protein [Tenacibaculum maritimum]CAA0250863.1 conserved hypothetical protein [Tenacibaculum maritimum]